MVTSPVDLTASTGTLQELGGGLSVCIPQQHDDTGVVSSDGAADVARTDVMAAPVTAEQHLAGFAEADGDPPPVVGIATLSGALGDLGGGLWSHRGHRTRTAPSPSLLSSRSRRAFLRWMHQRLPAEP